MDILVKIVCTPIITRFILPYLNFQTLRNQIVMFSMYLLLEVSLVCCYFWMVDVSRKKNIEQIVETKSKPTIDLNFLSRLLTNSYIPNESEEVISKVSLSEYDVGVAFQLMKREALVNVANLLLVYFFGGSFQESCFEAGYTSSVQKFLE